MFSNKGCSCCYGQSCEGDCDKSLRNETQLKCCWELNTPCNERVLFSAPNECDLKAFGTIHYNCSSGNPTGAVCIKFYKGSSDSGCLIESFLVDEGSCVSFVVSDFNTITATLQRGQSSAQGEICINPMFKVD